MTGTRLRKANTMGKKFLSVSEPLQQNLPEQVYESKKLYYHPNEGPTTQDDKDTAQKTNGPSQMTLLEQKSFCLARTHHYRHAKQKHHLKR